MGITQTTKEMLKAVTTPKARDELKRKLFRLYMGLSFSKNRAGDKAVPAGINLIGHIRGDFGLGESCRLVAGALEASGIPYAIHNVPLNGPATETNLDWQEQEQSGYPYSVNLIHLNPNEISNAIWTLDPKALRGRYNIAYWLWELPEFPKEWEYTFQLFDEIWTPADFVSEAIRRRTDKPVYTMPYGLTQPKTDASFDRAYFGLPEDLFLFLLSYDGNSVSDRKNPEGTVRAFQQAFPDGDEPVGLVIKATHEKDARLKELLTRLEGRKNISVLTRSYTKVEFNSLIRCVDSYVSLHRAEGFGLVMAEAMLLGTPVIGTNWSANTEFMNGDVACMVDAEIVALERDYPPYHAGDHWAKPDEAKAAEWMRRLYDDAAYRNGLARRAKAYLEREFSLYRSGEQIKKRWDELTLEWNGNI